MVIMHMSGAYGPQKFYIEQGLNVSQIDCRDIEGTNCYCDDFAKKELRKRMDKEVAEDLHFFDSGNYHYLSMLWLEKVQEPFSLVLFDHHPDMQPPTFGMITSCGGWVKETLETNPFLQKVYMVGVDPKLIQELNLKQENYDGRVEIGINNLVIEENPIYISFDKDALCMEAARCDWDQGDLTLQEACDILDEIFENHQVIGMDVCGEDSKWEQAEHAEEVIRINDKTNGILRDVYGRHKVMLL